MWSEKTRAGGLRGDPSATAGIRVGGEPVSRDRGTSQAGPPWNDGEETVTWRGHITFLEELDTK